MRVILAILILIAAAPASAFETGRFVVDHDGLQREAIIDAPRNAKAAPMLIVLHGGLAGPQTVRRRARVTLQSQGWVVAYPYAIDDWNDGRVDSDGQPYDPADDVGFLRKLVQTLAANGAVDPARVFVAGPSIGGVMALRLWCEAPDLVAGIAVAITSFAKGYACPDGPPRPVLYIHGTDDTIMPPDGGRIGGGSLLVRDRGRVASVPETVAHIAARNGCAGFEEQALPDRTTNDDSTVTRRTYRGCAAPLVHFVVKGGGHTWPGGAPSRLGRFAGPTNQDFSATAVVQLFFQRLAGE